MSAKAEKRLAEIERRLEALERTVASMNLRSQGALPQSAVGVKELLALPDALRRTLLSLEELREATAEEVAKKSGRTRGIETIYLNQLVRMGYVTRTKRGRKIYFLPLKYY